jgi:photosystem II stability/assembly factor-like uncharacterized protein
MPRRHMFVLAIVLVSLGGLLASCGSSSGESGPLARLTPGPSLPARPGADVWIVGLPDVVLATNDGGASWRLAHHGELTSESLGDLWDVAFADSTHGWTVERGGGSVPTRILATGDGGTTWNSQYSNAAGKLVAVSASGLQHAWAAGYSGSSGLLLATNDGGTTWRQQHVPGDLVLYDIAFGDARHGWALGTTEDHSPDAVLATVDGGAHWRLSYEAKAGNLSRLACSGTKHCWVAGSAEQFPSDRPGFIVATADGGKHWRLQRLASNEALRDVAFPDARHGWVVGPRGTILATADGGTTWAAQQTDSRYDLKAVAFSDAAHGWALIGNVGLLATIDGGMTWTVVRPTQQAYYFAAITCLGPASAEASP